MAPLFLAVEPRLRAAGSLDGGFDPVPTPPKSACRAMRRASGFPCS